MKMAVELEGGVGWVVKGGADAGVEAEDMIGKGSSLTEFIGKNERVVFMYQVEKRTADKSLGVVAGQLDDAGPEVENGRVPR